MPKSKKRRTAKRKTTRPKSISELLTVPMPKSRPKHPGYTQPCPVDDLIGEFGEEGASWLQEAYGTPLTVAAFRLEQCIRRDAFVLDDPFTGPETVTAESLSKLLDMTLQVASLLAKDSGTLTADMAREVEELEADPIDHAADGADVAREAFQAGAIFLNDRTMWDFGGEEQHG